MTTAYRVRHLTRYAYDEPVTLGHNQALLLPRTTGHQVVRRAEVTVRPLPGDRRSHRDVYGNTVLHFSLDEPHDTLEVIGESEVAVTAAPSPAADAAGPWEASVPPPGRLAGEAALLRDFALPSPLVPALGVLADYAEVSFAPGRPGVEAVLELCARLHDELTFDPGVTTVATPVSEVMELRRGVCQDFAHVTVGCLRAMGLAARYVSGYLETDPPPGTEKLQGADASHAWCSVWLAGLGWLDVDPTNDQVPDERHVTVAWGRDYGDVTPLKGVVFAGGADHELTVEVDVLRLD